MTSASTTALVSPPRAVMRRQPALPASALDGLVMAVAGAVLGTVAIALTASAGLAALPVLSAGALAVGVVHTLPEHEVAGLRVALFASLVAAMTVLLVVMAAVLATGQAALLVEVPIALALDGLGVAGGAAATDAGGLFVRVVEVLVGLVIVCALLCWLWVRQGGMGFLSVIAVTLFVVGALAANSHRSPVGAVRDGGAIVDRVYDRTLDGAAGEFGRNRDAVVSSASR